MITDAHLEQLLRDERDSFGEPDAALLDRASVEVVDSPEPVRRHRVRSLLVGVALLVPLVVAVLVVAGHRSDPEVQPAAATTTLPSRPFRSTTRSSARGSWRASTPTPPRIGIGRSCGSTTTARGRDPTAATASAARGVCRTGGSFVATPGPQTRSGAATWTTPRS